MNAKSTMMLKALLLRYHPEHRAEWAAHLPKKQSEELRALPDPRPCPLESLFSIDGWFKKIHYSWFFEPLATLSPALQERIFSLFSKEQLKGLSQKIPVPSRIRQLPLFGRAFLSEMLKQKVVKKDILEEPLLPSSKCDLLLDLTKNELVHLIDFLGIHDLAAELRHIVDRMLLNKISAALTEDQSRYLEYCSKLPMKWIPPKMNLNTWDGSRKQLMLLLHQRGLARLAKAIFDLDASFIWHLAHRLDTGRANVLAKFLKTKQDAALSSYFKNQVVELAKHFETREKGR